MQLIWDKENCEIGLQEKMTTHDQPSLDEKLVCNGISDETIQDVTTHNKDYKSVANSDKYIKESEDKISDDAVVLKTKETAQKIENGDNVGDVSLENKLTETISDENLSRNSKLTSSQLCDSESNTKGEISDDNITSNKGEDSSKITDNSENLDILVVVPNEKEVVKENVMDADSERQLPGRETDYVTVEVGMEINQVSKQNDDVEYTDSDQETKSIENSESEQKNNNTSKTDCIARNGSNSETGTPNIILEDKLLPNDKSIEDTTAKAAVIICSTVETDPNHNTQSVVNTDEPSSVSLSEVNNEKNTMECDEVSVTDAKDNEDKMETVDEVDTKTTSEVGSSELKNTSNTMECDTVTDDVLNPEITEVDTDVQSEVCISKDNDIQNLMECDVVNIKEIKESEEKANAQTFVIVKDEEIEIDTEKLVDDDMTDIECVPVPPVESQAVTEITAYKGVTETAENQNKNIPTTETIIVKDETTAYKGVTEIAENQNKDISTTETIIVKDETTAYKGVTEIAENQNKDIPTTETIIVKDETTAYKGVTETDENLNKDIPTTETFIVQDEILVMEETKEVIDSKPEALDKNNLTVKSPTQEKDLKEVVEVNTSRPTICKLSNTLDILSDDDEEPPKKEESSEKSIKSTDEKQCINLDDDDDIMLIDDDTISKNETVQVANENVTTKDQVSNEAKPDASKVTLNSVQETQTKDAVVIDDEQIKDSAIPETNEIVATPIEPETIKPKEEHKSDHVERQKLIVPDNFFKTYKKNLAEMTRDDLEEFCVLKIVESIIDRSSLNEIRSKIKTMSQAIDEYKRKTMMLTKQNRDLQVVLKSIQEEQKKAGDTAITPLKITRSVGMQVLMTDKIRRRPIPAPQLAPTGTNQSTPLTNFKPGRNANQSPKPPRPPSNNQQIPVPRLVPASNNSVIKTNNSTQPNTANSPIKAVAPIQNGVKMPAGPKAAEKRPYNRVQSVTVDLTDDEPPSKVTTKSPAPPVRLVPPHNLLAQRPQQFPQVINSPRKVYIPISGTQNQNVKQGTVTLKSVPPQGGPRPRTPANQMVRLPQSSMRVVRVQGSRHPAPLPDAMKQYQPPNWKALPPAPDLKLSKVENGIVISWKIEGFQEDSYEEIASYQLYAYQETSAQPSTSLWKKIGDVKALPLPMACTLTQFMAGYKYYFAVRAVDIRSRLGPFSLPGSILLINKM